MKHPQLTDLIDIQILQQIQDAFSEFTGMAALITDEEGSPITKASGFSDFCSQYTEPENYAVPITLEGCAIGSFIGGQIPTKPIDMMQVRKNAQELVQIISNIASKRNEDLKQSRRLEQAAKSQAAFLIDMNTEFQNNMKTWIHSAKQALESGNSETMEEAIRQLLVKGAALLSNFSDTVAYAKMTDGKIVLKETVYNIEKLLQFVCYNVEEQLEDKPIMIIRQIDDNVPSKLLGDQGKIGQIINRLLMNLVQHMDEGVITVHISSETSGYAEKLTIQITDTEMKMPAENFEQMRHYIKHGGDEIFDGQSGDEVNLSMILFLLKQVSGSMELERIEGTGNAFTVHLPQLKLA